MRPKTFAGLADREQRVVWERRATDKRPRISSGFPAMDDLLNRGGFAPGELVVLGGRTHTRKSTVMLNMTERLLRQGVPVGFVGLDEPTPSYIAKLASCFLNLPHAYLEETFEEPRTVERLEQDFWPHARRLSITEGYRPSFEQLTSWLEMADTVERPRVVFIDYVALLARDKYHGSDASRIPRVFEDLQVWTSEQDVVTVALHQVARGEHGREYVPMQLDHLKYGGEEFADVVLGTYRPALEPLGNHGEAQAELEMGDKWDKGTWENAVTRVTRTKNSTFLQLLKNRPGVHLFEEGVELLSPTEAMWMTPADRDSYADDQKVRALHA